ncbi:hypothetical protein MNBD_GAMMA11-19, partial [hydrothermal vent metagenome]
MKNSIITSAVAAILGTAVFNANASSIADADTLTINDGGSVITGCQAGSINPDTGNCRLDGTDDPRLNITEQTGSFFALAGGTTNLSNYEGIILGSTQRAFGSHPGVINSTESPSIDVPWVFASNTGMHQTTSPVTIISQTELDFTGWGVIWNGLSVPLGGCQTVDPANNNGFSGCDFDRDGIDDVVNTGIASISITGDTYVLDYLANVPTGDPSGTGG